MSNLNDIFFTPAANQELTYDQVLEDVQRYFAENHASTIAEAGEGNAERATSCLLYTSDYSKHPEAKYLRSCKASAHVPEWRRLEEEAAKTPQPAPKPAPAAKKPAKRKATKPASPTDKSPKEAVSYTHLDVYKRQIWICSSPVSPKKPSSRKSDSSCVSTVPKSRTPATPTPTLMTLMALSEAGTFSKRVLPTTRTSTT